MIMPTKTEWEKLLSYHKDEEYNCANRGDYHSAEYHQERAKQIIGYLNSPKIPVTNELPEIFVVVPNIGLCKATLEKIDTTADKSVIGNSVLSNYTEIK